MRACVSFTPWPITFCGTESFRGGIVSLQEKETVFLLDDNRINEVNMVTGRTPVGKSSGGASDPLWEGLLLFSLL